jgi:hypothetical protein
MQPGGAKGAAAAAGGAAPPRGLAVPEGLGSVTALELSPCGCLLAAGTSRGALLVWDVSRTTPADPLYKVGWGPAGGWAVQRMWRTCMSGGCILPQMQGHASSRLTAVRSHALPTRQGPRRGRGPRWCKELFLRPAGGWAARDRGRWRCLGWLLACIPERYAWRVWPSLTTDTLSVQNLQAWRGAATAPSFWLWTLTAARACGGFGRIWVGVVRGVFRLAITAVPAAWFSAALRRPVVASWGAARPAPRT